MKTLVLTTLSVIALTGCMSSAKKAPKIAPNGEISISVKGDDYGKLIKQTYKTTKKQCGGREPILLSQELLQDNKALDIPLNLQPNSPLRSFFAIINSPTLKAPSATPKGNYEYQAKLKCSSFYVKFAKPVIQN